MSDLRDVVTFFVATALVILVLVGMVYVIADRPQLHLQCVKRVAAGEPCIRGVRCGDYGRAERNRAAAY